MRDRTVAALAAGVIIVLAIGFTWWSIVDPTQPESAGGPIPWQFNFQKSASPIQDRLYYLHNLLFVLDVVICAFVAVMLAIIVVRFRAGVHPQPDRTSHNTALEIAWTLIPVVILIAMAVPSFRYLLDIDIPPPTELTVKVTGHQWYWDYEYTDRGGVTVTSVIEQDPKALEATKQPRLLGVDNPLVLPVGVPIRIQVTGADVIHSFSIPSLGVKKDAMPGRLNEIWTEIRREGRYYGQCYELCGINHAYMPVAVDAVSREAFDAFIAGKRKSAEAAPPSPPRSTAAPAPASRSDLASIGAVPASESR